MANNYSQFSTEFDFPKEAAAEFLSLITACKECDPGKTDPELLKEVGFDVNSFDPDEAEDEKSAFETWIWDRDFNLAGIEAGYEDGKLWLYNDGESVDTNVLSLALSKIMKRHGVAKPVMIEEAYYCDKPRIYEFGGGVFVIGPDMVEFRGTRGVGEKMIEDMEKKIKAAKKAGPKMQG